ncbi:MAG: aminoacetone oxidase family FAD-binding enzyme [Anaerolineae bacterium]|jgi:predicted Rossmann fold flavoprotein|nr:aminoacetone oxidase family FAD-binding enzyme [Chloroflexota bacterium]
MSEHSLRVAVIGGGPAGIMAALEAARRGARVSLYDSNASVGRKLLVTGNGRCNISHVGATAGDYVCDDVAALETILGPDPHQRLVTRLRKLAILTWATDDGWCYPVSQTAATVVAALDAALRLAKVDLRLSTQVRDIVPRGRALGLIVGDPEHPKEFERVVLASGGRAHPALGSTGHLYATLARLGHKVLPQHPALVAIDADMRSVNKLQGVRLDAGLSLYAGRRLLGRQVGNALFTATGISGPAAMNLSHLVHDKSADPLVLEIDLLALHWEALEQLYRSARQDWPVAVLLGAVLPQKIAPVLLRMAKLPGDVTLNGLNKGAWEALISCARSIRLKVRGTRDFSFAQLSTGGVPLAEIDPASMASRRVPGLYLAGEVLNVIGPCGGYNLLFALTSGEAAGRGATDPGAHGADAAT